MKNLSKITAFCFTLIMTLMTFQARAHTTGWEEGVAAIVATEITASTSGLVKAHFKAIKGDNYAGYKATFKSLSVFNDTIMVYFKAARGYVVTQDLQEVASRAQYFKFKPGPKATAKQRKNFQNHVLVVIPAKSQLRKSDRLPYDILGISAELGAGLKAKGINPSTHMAFWVNTTTNSFENQAGWGF